MTSTNRRMAQWTRALMALSVAVVGSVSAQAASLYEFATPVLGFGVAPEGSLEVADAGAGIVELRKGTGAGSLVAALPGVTDVAPIGRGVMWATRGGGPGLTTGALFRVSRGSVRQVADLYAFEAANNPHPDSIDSNPFDVEPLSGNSVLVADAAANALLRVDSGGRVDWIATLPNELVSSAALMTLVGCPTPVAGFEFVCDLPAEMPAQPVTASVAIGPDGYYYVGELKGFPAPVGASKIWRINPRARHAQCGTSTDCSIVLDGFTSIVDLKFGPDKKLYVVELDEASWAAVEFQLPGLGGTVNACDLTTHTCTEVATQLSMPIAIGFDRQRRAHVAVNALIPGAAEVITLP